MASRTGIEIQAKGERGKTKDHRDNRKDLPPPVLVLPKPEEPKPEL